MPESSTISPDRPSVPPGHPPLDAYVHWVWGGHGDEIEFVILFGSRARGDALDDSNYDVLVGLRGEDGRRFVDRLGVFQDTETGKCDVFAYAPSELAEMERDDNLLLLEALADGRPLFDRGAWARMRERFQHRVTGRALVRTRLGWEIH